MAACGGIIENSLKTEEVNKIDAIELTLLLKAAGFRLEYLDYGTKSQKDNGLLVEIKCSNSGIISKLSFNTDEVICSCPTKSKSNNNSFWEVQGSAPSTPNNKITDSSSNLLPTIGPNVMEYTNTMLQQVLKTLRGAIEKKYLPTNFNIKQFITRLNVKNEEQITNPVEQAIQLPVNKPPVNLEHCATPLSSINVTPTTSNQFANATAGIPKIILQTGNGNTKSEEKPFDGSISTEEIFVTPSADIFTSSPNTSHERVKEMLINERDSNITHMLNESRKNIDHAMNLLKFNVTQDFSSHSVISEAQRNGNTMQLTLPQPTVRRHSLSALQKISSLASPKTLNKPPTPVSSTNKSTIRRSIPLRKPIVPIKQLVRPVERMKTQTLVGTSKLLIKNDTPRAGRPGIKPLANTKVIRPNTSSTSSTTSTGTTVKSNLAKPISKSLSKLPTIEKK